MKGIVTAERENKERKTEENESSASLARLPGVLRHRNSIYMTPDLRTVPRPEMRARGETRRGGLAQLVEHLLCKQGVNGSSPLSSTREKRSLTCWEREEKRPLAEGFRIFSHWIDRSEKSS